MSKKKHEEHENHERWIIPYADMVTLLFAFFVVMYAMSLQDKKKMEAVAASVAQAFIGGDKGGGSQRRMVTFDDQAATPPNSSPRFMVRRVTTNEEIIDELRQALDQEGFDLIMQEELSPMDIKIDSRGVAISISAGFLFDEGSTEVRPELFPVLSVIGDVMKASGRYVEIEGHTDDRPILGNVFYSNWEVSALRATSMVRTLTQHFGADPKKLRAAGLAQYRPVGSNDTDFGRSQNRRVEIVLLNATTASELLEDPTIPR